jgi:hypothetical protein
VVGGLAPSWPRHQVLEDAARWFGYPLQVYPEGSRRPPGKAPKARRLASGKSRSLSRTCPRCSPRRNHIDWPAVLRRSLTIVSLFQGCAHPGFVFWRQRESLRSLVTAGVGRCLSRPSMRSWRVQTSNALSTPKIMAPPRGRERGHRNAFRGLGAKTEGELKRPYKGFVPLPLWTAAPIGALACTLVR